MTTILLYLLVQFNIGTSTNVSTDAEAPVGGSTEYLQNTDGGAGSWGDGENI